MNINELAQEVHKNAVACGEWDTPPTLPEALCSIHAEVSSALAEYQAGNPPRVRDVCDLSRGLQVLRDLR